MGIFTNNIVCMQLICAITKRCNPQLELVVAISIIGFADRSAHMKLYYVQTLCINPKFIEIILMHLLLNQHILVKRM